MVKFWPCIKAIALGMTEFDFRLKGDKLEPILAKNVRL